MDNRHRWDEVLAEVRGEESPARQRQREIDELEREQKLDGRRSHLQEVAGEFTEEPDQDRRVFSRELLESARYDTFDVIGEHQRAGDRAVAQQAEREVLDSIRSVGDSLPDSPGGSFTLEDFQQAHYDISTNGTNPDTILLHPGTAGIIFDEYSHVSAPADSRVAASGFVAPLEVQGEEIVVSGVMIGPLYLENGDYGVSVDDMVGELQMAAPASGVLFGYSRRIPNEIALPHAPASGNLQRYNPLDHTWDY